MRRPLRAALLWWLAALVGGAVLVLVTRHDDTLGEVTTVLIALPALTAIPFGFVYGTMAALAAFGAARLRRGTNVLARWDVGPVEWEAFRRFDAIRATAGYGLASEVTPRPATAPVVVVFGHRQVLVDDAYVPLRAVAIPELRSVGWLEPPDAPPCIELGLAYPRGRSGGVVPTALRVPVPAPARDDAIRVYWHFEAIAPKPRVGLAERRPKLVIGGGVAVTAVAALVAALAWQRHAAGDQSDGVLIALLSGILFAIGGACFTVIVALVLWGRGRTSSAGHHARER